MMAGHATVESAPGRGSTFTVAIEPGSPNGRTSPQPRTSRVARQERGSRTGAGGRHYEVNSSVAEGAQFEILGVELDLRRRHRSAHSAGRQGYASSLDIHMPTWTASSSHRRSRRGGAECGATADTHCRADAKRAEGRGGSLLCRGNGRLSQQALTLDRLRETGTIG